MRRPPPLQTHHPSRPMNQTPFLSNQNRQGTTPTARGWPIALTLESVTHRRTILPIVAPLLATLVRTSMDE